MDIFEKEETRTIDFVNGKIFALACVVRSARLKVKVFCRNFKCILVIEPNLKTTWRRLLLSKYHVFLIIKLKFLANNYQSTDCNWSSFSQSNLPLKLHSCNLSNCILAWNNVTFWSLKYAMSNNGTKLKWIKRRYGQIFPKISRKCGVSIIKANVR